MARTRKVGKKGKVLKVDSVDKISSMEKMLGKGSITFVLVYADWCGACTRFKKNIWNPMCEKSAIHSRMAVRDDMIKNTSLKGAEFDYLPSLIVVDEKGNMQNFKTPEGKNTNAMPTPQSLRDMNRIVNVPVTQDEEILSTLTPITMQSNSPQPITMQSNSPQPLPLQPTEPLSLQPTEPLSLQPTEPLSLQQSLGKKYVPTPMVAPPMKGGRHSRKSTKGVRRTKKSKSKRGTIIPNKVLKGIAGLFKKHSRKN
jgi:hypothetical protein